MYSGVLVLLPILLLLLGLLDGLGAITVLVEVVEGQIEQDPGLDEARQRPVKGRRDWPAARVRAPRRGAAHKIDVESM